MPLRDGYTDIAPGKIAAVVTSLEMRASECPPLDAGAPDPVAHGWTVRHRERPELGWYRELYRRIGEDWLWFSRTRMGDADLRKILHDPRVEVHSLDVGGKSEGFVELDFRVDGEAEIAFLGVSPPLIGRGAGRLLMRAALERAWLRGVARIWLHTCTLDHPGALAFYRRAGFTAFRRQIEVADDPRLADGAPRGAAPHVPII